jgi:hypothetical protein
LLKTHLETFRKRYVTVWHQTSQLGGSTPAPYSGCPRFKSWPRGGLSWLSFLWFSSVTPGKCWVVRPQPLFSLFFTIYCLLIILSLDAVQSASDTSTNK